MPPTAARDTAVVHHLTTLINAVYQDAEGELWQGAVARTDADEVAAVIGAGQMIVARGTLQSPEHAGDGDDDPADGHRAEEAAGGRGNLGASAEGPIIGVVQAHADGGRGWFGMLAVDPGYRGAGIGRALVRAAEELVADAGGTEVEISVIMATDDSFAPKTELSRWYQRLGYVPVETVSVAEAIPGMETMLAVPCHMQILRKTLSST